MHKAGQGAFLALFIALLLAAAPARAADPLFPPPAALPTPTSEGRVDHLGASIWYATFGQGRPVILLHGGLASSDIWDGQVPALIAAGYQVILIDSRGHGRSTLGPKRLGYALMESDVVAVMDATGLPRADVVGWSDGAIIALIMAMKDPDRTGRIFAFAANMDVSGLNPLGAFAPALRGSLGYLRDEYARDGGADWSRLEAAVVHMQLTQPHYDAADLAAIHGPAIAIADGDRDEVISHRHTRWLARTIPGAQLLWLPHAGHLAPVQAPDAFNQAMLSFLSGEGASAADRPASAP